MDVRDPVIRGILASGQACVWYDEYERGIIRPGLIANAFRFENPDAGATAADPRYAALYDIVSSDPAAAWPAVASSPDYPTYLFDDATSATLGYAIAPAARRPNRCR